MAFPEEQTMACVYSSIKLLDENSPITPESIQASAMASNVNIDPLLAQIFAKAAGSIDLKQLIKGFSEGNCAESTSAIPDIASQTPATAKVEEVEEEEEEDEDMGFGLFD